MAAGKAILTIGMFYRKFGMALTKIRSLAFDMAKSYIRSIMARESSDRIKAHEFLVFLKDDYPFPLITGIARMAAINLRKLLLSSSNNAELAMKLSQRILTF